MDTGGVEGRWVASVTNETKNKELSGFLCTSISYSFIEVFKSSICYLLIVLQVYNAPASMNFIVPLSVHLTMKHSCPLNVKLKGGIEMNGERVNRLGQGIYTPSKSTWQKPGPLFHHFKR